MRHNKKRGMKLGTDASHTKAMKRSLVASLLANDRIKTLDVRAKAIRPDVDKVITWAKKGDLHSRRLAIAKIGDKEIVREIFEKAAQGMWADRNGGYTRIMKLGPRKGDGAEVVIMELVTEAVTPKGKAKAAPKAAVTKVAPAKAEEPAAEEAPAKEAPAKDEKADKAEEAPAAEPKAEAEAAGEAAAE
ncbi:MAG: 50S ribosomal protein L17 [Coriobacteriaceae bacterium]|nr:50S ribosomal protein L17 [Coriobacteriaceae bacterium]